MILYNCISGTDVSSGESLVYCAPTSGGKTLVSELLILRSVMYLKKKAIFVLPYVSLVLEKETYFKKLVNRFNRQCHKNDKIKVMAFHGEMNVSQVRHDTNIIICTIEKANALVNTLITNCLGHMLGCVVVDEMHTLGDSFNGYLLEILISKLKYMRWNSLQNEVTDSENMNALSTNKSQSVTNIQLIAMSATVGNIQELAAWFNAKLYISDYRPVPLQEMIVAGDTVYDNHGKVYKKLALSPPAKTPSSSSSYVSQADLANRVVVFLCAEGLTNGQQLLIFCPTKKLCQLTCEMLVAQLVPLSKANLTHSTVTYTAEQLIQARDRLRASIQKLLDKTNDSASAAAINPKPTADTDPSKTPSKDAPSSTSSSSASLIQSLQECMKHGIAYHHAGLDSAYRQIVEKGFKAGEISILAATSTLAAGVNLPAGRVLIRSL